MYFFGSYFVTPFRYMGIVYVIMVLLVVLLEYYTLVLSEILVCIIF
ncbi:MAG: hypothetical protein H6Q69_3698 [Firmicutes bacterium]|nr:hypothetical protein [Bacillota bacterium]MBP2660666.1 hypothetical protein [Bacillota bacterium]